MKINNFDVDLFLTDYWQKKPLVVRNAFSEPFWLDPDDLAGLSLEIDAESRIISQEESTWKVEHGPFDESTYSHLPEKNWTLLVQAVDQWEPQLQQLLASFHFLPSWRLDDVMVSYAPVGGTVSQHFDFFDVFLIQGEGSRKWQIGGVCDSSSELLSDTAVQILKEFEPALEFILQPGDMLYIPAKHSHLGVSVQDSLTYSIGFRAPSIRDMVDGIATTALESLTEDERYTDSTESLSALTGEISEATINEVQEMLTRKLLDRSAISSWLGQYVTERKYPDLELSSTEDTVCLERLSEEAFVYRHAASRYAYTKEGGCTLFVDGQSYKVDLALAELLSNNSLIDSGVLLERTSNPSNRNVVEALFLNGALTFDDDGGDE